MTLHLPRVPLLCTLMLRCIGLVLLSAGCIKILNGFLFFKMSRSLLFSISIMSDLIVGSLILVIPQIRLVLLSSLTTFGAYVAYRLATWSSPCSCFGKYSYLIPDIAMLAICVCGFCFSAYLLKSSPADTAAALKRIDLIRVIGLLVGILIALLLSGFSQSGSLNSLRGEFKESEINDNGNFGSIELINLCATSVKIVGMKTIGCKASLDLPLGLELAKFEHSELIGAQLPGVVQGPFVTGAFELFISRNDRLETARVEWIGIVEK